MIFNLQFAKVRKLVYEEKILKVDSKIKLKLDGLVYESIHVEKGDDIVEPVSEGLSFLDLSDFQPQPYEQLAKVLNSRGNENEAILVLIEKENKKLNQLKRHSFSWFWKQLLRVSISYGYRPQRSLLWGFIVVVTGYFVFNLGYKNALITPTTDSFTSKPAYFSQKDADSKDSCAKVIDPKKIEDCPKYPKFDPIIYSLDTFLPIIDLHLKGYWLPNANATTSSTNINWGYWLRVYFIVHTILGWAIVTLAVAGFSGLVRNIDSK
jgi:hypothetical protein